jgi:hypothetical protein
MWLLHPAPSKSNTSRIPAHHSPAIAHGDGFWKFRISWSQAWHLGYAGEV